jgi:uncharacterized tellurite resistance protein B-like protein
MGLVADWDFRKWLGLDAPAADAAPLAPVIGVLRGLEPDRARYVAGFAYLLGRVAAADSDVSIGETELMGRLVALESGLAGAEADAAVRLALEEAHRSGGTHNVSVARDFASIATHDQRLGLLRCLFAVSAADDSVKVVEDNEIRRISRELRIEHADFIRARLEVREHLAVLRRTP